MHMIQFILNYKLDGYTWHGVQMIVTGVQRYAELIKFNKSPFTSETGRSALKLKSRIELDLSDTDFNDYFEFCKQ